MGILRGATWPHLRPPSPYRRARARSAPRFVRRVFPVRFSALACFFLPLLCFFCTQREAKGAKESKGMNGARAELCARRSRMMTKGESGICTTRDSTFSARRRCPILQVTFTDGGWGAVSAHGQEKTHKFILLERWMDAFEENGAETRQRSDDRRSWWTAQLRAERNQHNIPFLVTCVSHWMKTAKERIVFALD